MLVLVEVVGSNNSTRSIPSILANYSIELSLFSIIVRQDLLEIVRSTACFDSSKSSSTACIERQEVAIDNVRLTRIYNTGRAHTPDKIIVVFHYSFIRFSHRCFSALCFNALFISSKLCLTALLTIYGYRHAHGV